jgi:hypothetical protein
MKSQASLKQPENSLAVQAKKGRASIKSNLKPPCISSTVISTFFKDTASYNLTDNASSSPQDTTLYGQVQHSVGLTTETMEYLS